MKIEDDQLIYPERDDRQMNLTYTECGTEEMLGLIRDRNYDLGFLFVPVSKMPAFEHMIRRRHIIYHPLLSSDLVVHSGPESNFYGKDLVKPEELNGCECIQMEDDYFSVEELLMSHKSFHSGSYKINKMIRTNSDHLIIRMLQQTSLCNIGSFWQENSYGGYDFSVSVIDGFQKQVSFGYLTLADKALNPEAKEFVDKLMERII